jgi:glycosyltransferase involved in cell wall biosynthesis
VSISEVKFTAIVCTYNYAHLLPDALRSLAAQTVRDFELLIADDGSTDHTEEVARQFSSKFRNCVYLKKAHSGLADTRNVAVRKATGTHLAFLDADDLWSPHYLEAVRSRLESSPQTELVICNGLRILDNGKVLGPVFLRNLPHLEGKVDSVKNPYYLFNEFLPSGMTFLKSLYERIGAFDTRFDQGLGDDVDWVIRAVAAGAHCVRVHQKLFLYRYHGRNLTSNPILMLDPWLKIYDEQVKGGRFGPEFERNARNLTREYVLRVLAVCTPSMARSLVSQAMETFPEDIIFRTAYLSTYLGSTYALKALKWGKHLLQEKLPGRQRIDLSAPPETMFKGV